MKNIDVALDLGDEFKGMNIPSFKEFCANPDKYRTRKDSSFGIVDKGGQSINGITRRHKYVIEGYECKTLEEVERVARSQGIPVEALDYQPEVIPCGAGKCDLKIEFIPKWKKEQRDAR